MATYTFEFEDRLKEKLEKIADSEHRTLAGQLRLVVEEYLERNADEKKRG